MEDTPHVRESQQMMTVIAGNHQTIFGSNYISITNWEKFSTVKICPASAGKLTWAWA